MIKRKVLISGGSGYVGRALAERLLAKGHQVSAFHRNEKPADPGAISWIRVDDLATMPVDPLIGSDIDVFVNLAASLQPTSTDADGSGSQTAGIARNMSQFIAEAGIRRVIVMSSIAAKLAQNDQPGARRYGVEKLAADDIFLGRLKDEREIVVLRPPAIYGPGMQNSLTVLARLIRRGLPIPLGSATAPRHYMSIRNLCDLVETIIRSSDDRWVSASGHIFEPSDGQAIATDDLIRMMGAAMGRKPRSLPVPLAVLRMMGAATGRSELVSGAIDRLDVAPVEELEAAFGWRPLERMPESLAFLGSGGGSS